MTAKNILVPIDFTPGSERALDYACSLAEKLGATIHLVHAIGASIPELNVVLTDKALEALRSEHQGRLQKVAAARASLAKFGRMIVEAGDPRDAIGTATAVTKADLIVIGSHGRRGLSRLMLGSVAEDTVRHASCPVLVVRTPKAAS